MTAPTALDLAATLRAQADREGLARQHARLRKLMGREA